MFHMYLSAIFEALLNLFIFKKVDLLHFNLVWFLKHQLLKLFQGEV